MSLEYPYFVNNIRDILRWFDEQIKERTGNKVPPSSFSYLGGRLKKFANNNDLTIDELKTLIWGVMNEKSNMYSPVYAFYFIDKLEEYQDLRREMERRKEEERDTEVDFDKDSLIEEKDNKDIGDDFFEEL